MSDERKPMTDEELDASKKRTDAITPGPWRVYYAHVPEDIARLLAEVERLNKVSRYLAARLSPLNVTRRKYIGATLEDGYGNGLFFTREEAIQSWIDEANREVSNAE